jgi:calcineurin-like phosphoesterase family protein
MLYAVGDIHGEVDLLDRLIEEIRLDARGSLDTNNKLVFVGDYIDRGPSSFEVIERVMAGFDGFETVCIRGNHEQAMLELCRKHNKTMGKDWLTKAFGGMKTLKSYGIKPRSVRSALSSSRKLSKVLEPIPLAHLEFIENMPLLHQEHGYLFVHAGIRPGITLECQRDVDLMWIGSDFTKSKFNHGYIVVHGHSCKKKPQMKKNRIGIDTGAFSKGCLTAVALNGHNKPRFIQVRK